MMTLVFAILLCSSGKANAVLNSTEESSASQSVATSTPWNDTPQEDFTIQTLQTSAQDNEAGGDIVELDAEEDGSAQDDSGQTMARFLRRRKSTRRRWTRRRRGGRRRRKSLSTDPCSDIDTAVCQTTDYTACIVGCLYISSRKDACETACEKTIVDPCIDQLQKACKDDALEVCEDAVKEAGAQSCEAICSEAAATALAAGGGPEDPAADAIAAEIEAGCAVSCETAVEDDLEPGTDAFAEAVCKGIGL